MSIVNFTSGINNLEERKSLSEWAVEFISENKISRGNIFHSTAFRNLSRRQKDAVRYQLKKDPNPEKLRVMKTPKTTTEPVATTPTAKLKTSSKKLNEAKILVMLKIALSLWISGFLLVDIVKIYVAKGMSPALAWQTALLVEVCFFVASICQTKRIRKIAYCFLFYNAFLFGFSEVSQLMAVAQLERDLIAERVRNGLANAKAKGVRLGRLKTRDSDLIRKLRASGMNYRQIAQIAKCSSGAVSAEIRLMKLEAKKKAEAESAAIELEDHSSPRSDAVNGYGNILEEPQPEHIVLELER